MEREKGGNCLALNEVWFSFDSRVAESQELALFRGLNLAITAGESFGVIGPGGEGKTTLLKMMAGLINPREGTCHFEGVTLSKLPRSKSASYRRRIGMTFQKSGLFDSLSCGENLDFPLRELTKMSASERQTKVEQSLVEVGLGGQAKLAISEMSGGMQKRLSIARSLLLSPNLVLYDDPTAGLDPVTSRSILDLINQMRTKYSMTIVIVASDPGLVYSLCDRIGFLYQGEFVQLGSPAEIRATTNPLVKQFIEGLTQGPLTQGGVGLD